MSYFFNIFGAFKSIQSIMTHFNRSFQCVNCENCNEKISILSVLKQEELEIVNDKRFEVRFKAGENIVKQGTASANLAFLTTGLAKEYIEGYDNRDLILELIQPWHLFGGPGIHVDMRYHYSVAALEDSTACFIDTVERELELVKRIDSAHVVKVLGYGVRQRIPYLALEYIDGPSIHDALVAHGPYSWLDARALLIQTAQGLADANAAGVIHRDVKPSNVLIGPGGIVKLTDFGIARGLDTTRMTATSTMLGTPAYLAPEGPAAAKV